MSSFHTVLVGPVDGGWRVECDLAGQPLMFLSGARAEAQAKALAAGLAKSGYDAHVVIRDRSDALVGATRYFSQSGAAVRQEGRPA